MSCRSRLSHQAGFSLVELMVALVINLLVIAGASELLANNRRTYRVDEANANMQDAMRFGHYLISGTIREAGFGCLGSISNVVNTLNDSTDLDYDFEDSIQGYDSDTGYPDEVASDVVSGSDVLVIRSGYGTQVSLESEMPDSSAVLKTTALESSPISTGDIVVLTDCSSAAIFQVTNYTDANGNIVHNTGNSVEPGNATKSFNHSYSAGSQVLKIHSVVYYLTDNEDGQRVLIERSNESGTVSLNEMVIGIEDMQITYGVDTDASDGVDEYVEAGDITDWNDVLSIRVALLMTSTEDNLTIEKQTYDFNGTTVTATDNRIYRSLSFVTALRNRTE
ncbi:PilW family protein [Oceanobacter mangrovi]|uniref:PilW family protein n=1 Tax=Oceanobacter mangrovi TaxID=2862510 RepID=UPI0024848140|nr:PilW family protein [Oceanobacter mangrovi]